ncbi:hypothetical protein ABE288_07835 [Bacillus salipaludis]|uniref:hypothetical protein n=1 Tax=Bacillus salipaludis TaxID=2547811 RepID=UPI003D21E7F9
MNNIKASHYINIEHIAGEFNDFRISVDFDGNLILLTEKDVQGKYFHKIFHFLNQEINEIIVPLVSETFDFAQPLCKYTH